MKLMNLKRKEIRKSFVFEGEEILVYNPDEKKQEIITQFILKHTDVENKRVEIADKEVLTFLFPLLTNLEMPENEKEIAEILSDPNYILVEISLELRDIIAEIAKTTIHSLKGNVDLARYTDLTEEEVTNILRSQGIEKDVVPKEKPKSKRGRKRKSEAKEETVEEMKNEDVGILEL